MARNGGGDRTSLDFYLGTSIVPWRDAGRDRSASGSGHDPDAIQAPRVPAEVAGRYLLGDKLGAGGFGVVYRATDRVTGEQVAVKLLDPGRGAAPVRREAVALRGLRLPGVVRLLDEGRDEDRPFLVMALVEGLPFPGLATPAPWAAIEDATLRLLEVLGRVHAAGALHLDIKPANVRVTPAGAVVLLDLGLAHGPALGGAAGSLGGTERYMAPELRGREADERSDLYSVGVMLWEALTGDVPDEVMAVLDALLARDPALRPASAWAALDRLVTAQGRRHGPGQGWAPPLAPDAEIVDEAALRACFHGPERVLHVPADAAARLHARTRGRRERVVAELQRWIRMGLAVPAGERLRMLPAALDQLDAEAAALRLARPEADIDAVRDVDAVTGLEFGPGAGLDVDSSLDFGLRAGASEDVHISAREVALARRIAAGQADAAVRAALAIARDRLTQGRMGRTRVALEQALLLIRRGEVSPAVGAAVEPRLLGIWARMAFELRARGALDVALYEVDRAMHRTAAARAVAALLRAALHADSGPPERAWQHLDRLARFEDPALDLLRHGVRLRLASRQGMAQEAAMLASIEEALAPVQERDDVRARLLGWRGHLRYQEGCFEDAAALQEQAAARAPAPAQRLGFLLNSASAWMEVGRFAHAETLAQEALAQAGPHRYRVFEAHAEWLLRSVAYRARRDIAPDLELVDAVGPVGVPYLEGMICLTEAAVAWRRGALEMAGDLAARARKRFEAADLRAGRVLAHALALACRAGYVPGRHRRRSAASAAAMITAEAPGAEDLDALAREVLDAPIPDVDWQVLGMLAPLPGGARWRADAVRLARAAARPDQRRELLAPRAVLAIR